MATEVWHELGPVPGECTVCGAGDYLRMGEVRSQPTLAERLRREPVTPPTRLVTCGGCGWRWTVRATDSPPLAVAAVVGRHGRDDSEAPAGVERRRSDLPAPRTPSHSRPEPRMAATWDVLPCPRDRRRLTSRLR